MFVDEVSRVQNNRRQQRFELTGYRRPDGRVGIRNHVAVLAAADNVNPLARQLVAAEPGTVLVRASYGRGQLGEDFELALRTMAGFAAHPNVAECLIVSFEPESAARIAERATKHGRRCETLSLLKEGGFTNALARGREILKGLKRSAGMSVRTPIAAQELVVGLECGGSDTTSGLFGNPSLGAFTDLLIETGGTAVFSEPVECLGGETLLRARAASPHAAAAMIAAIQRYDKIARDQGIDLSGTNPTPDNMAGGLTTIEEKSLGALAKTGTKPIQSVLSYGARPPQPGLWMMDAPAAAVENLTALAGAGAQLIMFVTGSGNPVGHPLAPTIKICANPATMASGIAEHIDVDLSDGLYGGLSTRDGGERIAAAFARVANGDLTAAERLDYLETSISRIGPSV